MNLDELVRSFKRDRIAQFALIGSIAMILLAVIGPLLVPDPQLQHLSQRLQPPGDGGVFGTDELGRSVFARMVYGLRTSYVIGIGAVVLGFVVGVSMGMFAGYVGGKVDWLIMRVTDVQMSLPALLIAAAVMTTTDGGVMVLILLMAFTAWTLYARVGRTLVLRLRASDFVASSRSLGMGPIRIMVRHLFPSILPQMVAIATLEFARVMLAEASLSFLGFGVQPPTISLGTILADGQDYLTTQWWITVFAGLALAFAVLGLNLFGSWLERVTDPTGAQPEAKTIATPGVVA